MRSIWKGLLGLTAAFCLCTSIGAMATTANSTVDTDIISAQAATFQYEAGVEYAADAEAFALNIAKDYKGHTTAQLNAFTDFFTRNEVQGEILDHSVLVSSSNTDKDTLMVLKFINPIDTAQFNRINLRVYINHPVSIATHNANDITEESVGDYMETFAVGGGLYSRLNLTSAYYADADGKVRQIVFRFLEDCTPATDINGDIIYEGERVVRDTFHFISYNVSQEAIVTKDSLMIKDMSDAYEVTFAFNKGGVASNKALDTSLVQFNGYTLSQILLECADAQAAWKVVKGVYQVQLILPKSYNGAAQVKNPQYDYAGNSMQVSKGLVFPNDDVLEDSYNCHLYANEKIIDCVMVDEFKSTKVERISYELVEGSDNIRFNLYFDKDITSLNYAHACETEQWRASELTKENYDGGISQVFVDGGYKTSLLDSVVVNGRTLGEWHAHDRNIATNVQVHYGHGGLDCVSVIFAYGCPNTYNELIDFVNAGEGVTIEVKAGWKFMVNTMTQETQTFVLKNSAFNETLSAKPLHVYFDGCEVSQGQTLTVQAETSVSSVKVEGPLTYSVEAKKEGNTTQYTVKYDGDNTFTFSVVEDIVESPSEQPQSGLLSGCNSSVAATAISGILTAIAATAVCVRGKKNEEDNR